MIVVEVVEVVVVVACVTRKAATIFAPGGRGIFADLVTKATRNSSPLAYPRSVAFVVGKGVFATGELQMYVRTEPGSEPHF